MAAVGMAIALGSPRIAPKLTVGFKVPSGTVQMSPSAVFSQSPYMGVRCPVPNSIACDQVGLAIWLRHPAFSVEASIAGAAVSLNWFGDERRLGRLIKPQRAFDGYLHPAGIVTRLHVQPGPGSTWYGNETPSPLVWVLVDYGPGGRVLTHLRVPLMAGWG
jgi:hypothetical protein